MSDDDKGRFARLTSRVKRGTAQLVGLDQEPDAKSFDGGAGDDLPYTVESEDYDRTEAPKDAMEEYWRQYETTPIVRKPISSFASQVIEPGYYLEADHLSEEEVEELEHWLENCAILEGELEKDFRSFAKKTIIQREVRGTAIVEKVPAKEDPDQLVAFKFLNPESIEAITRPNQTILLAPDDSDVYEDAPSTDDGEAAAYLQDITDTGQTMWGQPIEDRYRSESKVAFTREELIKFTRDADVGEVFGTSRLETVSDRIDGLKQKLSDNDEAIASKAYPLWLFMFGTEDEPWERDRINTFMKAHEMNNFHPGMKQGVRGDVSVETISGEVAEIAEYLQFDIDYIISSMPMPKYALGGFAESIGQVAGIAQQQDIQRQINEARRELESEFTPPIQEKAEQLGFDDPDDIKLKIGDPERPEETGNSNENIIRYIGNDENDGTNFARSIGEGDEIPDEDEDSDEESPDSSENSYAHIWDERQSVAELEFKNDRQAELAEVVYAAFEKARDDALESIDVASMQRTVGTFERDANRAIRAGLEESSVRRSAKSSLRDEIEDVQNEFTNGSRRFTNKQQTSHFADNVEKATRDVLDELMRRIRVEVRRGLEGGEEYARVKSRVLDKYSDASLRSRAELVAHMELTRARESTKLQEFEQSDAIVGFRVVAENAGTPLCESLDGARVMFDDDTSISGQLSDNTRDEFMHEGFNPIPTTPPFHYNCTTSIKPIYA